MSADLLLYALVAAGLVLWLRSLLGTRHGEERERPNPFASAAEDGRKDAQGAAPPLSGAAAAAQGMDEAGYILPQGVTIAGPAVEQDIAEIAHRHRAFDIAHFAAGVRDAFAIVVEAFAKGERETLRDFLSAPVLAAFEAALEDRQKKGESVSTEIHAVRHAEIRGAREKDGLILLTVQFTADETCVIRDKDGQILSGDPDRVSEMIDVWTFGREAKSKDPRWLVYETRDGEIVEDEKTPVPDAGDA